MPIYDYECECGHIFEAIEDIGTLFLQCAECGQLADRIISTGGQYCANEDADWIKSVVEVTNKKSRNPHTREFLKHPNRTNLRRHLSSSGLRHLEPGERLEPKPFDVERHGNRVFRERQRKNSLEVR